MSVVRITTFRVYQKKITLNMVVDISAGTMFANFSIISRWLIAEQ